MNITHSSKPNDSNTKLDLRFADDEDAEEIAKVVNESHLIECIEGSKYQYRNDGPRITVEEIKSNCSQASCRWIVLETPRPEELVVSTARLLMIPNENRSVIDLICSIPNYTSEQIKSDSSEPFSGICKSISSQLLAKAENIARGHGMEWLTIEVSQYRQDIMDWVSECGYEDNGGHMWPSNKPCGTGLSKPCMLLEFQKDLRIRNENDENSRMLFPISSSSNATTTTENKINNTLINKICDIPLEDDDSVEAQIFSTNNDDEYDTNYNTSNQTFSTFDFQDFANVLDAGIEAKDVIQVPILNIDDINNILPPNPPSANSEVKDKSIPSNGLMGSNDEMDNLVSTLFRALHAENND
jgi:hypothetical protein